MLVDKCSVPVDRKILNSHASTTTSKMLILVFSQSKTSIHQTYSRVIESKSEEWQLEIEIFVHLRIRSVDILLVIAVVITTALIEEPVEEVSSKFSQSCRTYGETLTIVSMCWWFIGCNTIHWIC